MLRLRASTWLLSGLVLLGSIIAAFPRAFLPKAWFTPAPAVDYGLSLAEVVSGLIMGLGALGSVGLLLYATIRSALQPTFRRDGAVLAGVIVTNGIGWLGALFFLQHR